MRNFPSYFISYRKFLLYSKGDSKVKNKGTDPEVKNIVHAKKVKKCCMRCKKLTCGCFTLNGKSVYLKLICEK